jgi:hypothetical protein
LDFNASSLSLGFSHEQKKLEKLKNITPSSSNFFSASIIFFIQVVNIPDLIFQL